MQWRVFTLACLLGAEILLTSIWFDGASLGGGRGLVSLLAQWGAGVLRAAVGFAGLFCTFAFLRHRKALVGLRAEEPVRAGRVLGHLGIFGGFLAWSRQVYGGGSDDGAVALWAVLALAVLVSAALAFVPWAVWTEAHRVTGKLWLWSGLAAGVAVAATPLVRGLWEPTTRATFAMVKFLLSFVLRDMVIQPERLRLGTERFTVIVSPECSGLEGIGLLLVFGVVWLALFRDELRFPRALLLLPVGVAVLYVSNAVRIAALVLIGDAGWREIAVRGFHSQAGWIAFNLVAFGLLLGARQVSWLSKAGPRAVETHEEEHPAAPYLLPFLAILAGGMVAGALSGGFEWFYGLRVLACAAALWMFRKAYAEVNWGFGWVGAAVGVVVFVIWIWGTHSGTGMPAELAAAAAGWRWGWIGLRVLGGVVLVPVAEELAFRGFGLRRVIDAEFDRVPWRAFSWPALLISSVVFGAMHGERWVVGIVAGMAYAMAMQWRGRLGDAVVAHGVTNGLLAAWALALGRWDLW